MKEELYRCDKYCFAAVNGHCTILNADEIEGRCAFYKTPQEAAEDRKAAKARLRTIAKQKAKAAKNDGSAEQH